VVQRSEHASWVLDLAKKEADRFDHRYLGPEHLVLGVLRDGGRGAARVLGLMAWSCWRRRPRLAVWSSVGWWPGPRPSDAELLSTLGIDLDTIRRSTEHTFGVRAVGGKATWRVTRRRGWWGQGWCGRRCVACRWSPSGPCSLPASRRTP
jgi:hypothetical protein